MSGPGMLTRTLSPNVVGDAEIRLDAPGLMARLRAARDGQPLRADKYTRLLINGAVWMTDAEYECATNRAVLRAAKGSVLIAGLGLGLIIGPMLTKKSVRHVTVIEISQDVIDLVLPNYDSPKLSVVCADVFKWRTAAKFDVIYFDIFQNVPNADDRADITRLRKRFAKTLNSGGWMAAWCEERTR